MYTLEHKYFKAESKAEYVYVQQVEYVYIWDVYKRQLLPSL